MPRPTFEDRMQTARAAFDAGFVSEANRKEALQNLGRAFDMIKEAIRTDLLADAPRAEGWDALYYDLPDYAHNWKAKHSEAYARWPEQVARAEAAVELRNAIKAAPVAPRPVREDHPLLAQVHRTFQDEMAARAARAERYESTLDLGRRLGGLPVSVRGHGCCNEGGTRWVRIDWYLRGERTAFNTIAAAYDQLVREGVIKEEAA